MSHRLSSAEFFSVLKTLKPYVSSFQVQKGKKLIATLHTPVPHEIVEGLKLQGREAFVVLRTPPVSSFFFTSGGAIDSIVKQSITIAAFEDFPELYYQSDDFENITITETIDSLRFKCLHRLIPVKKPVPDVTIISHPSSSLFNAEPHLFIRCLDGFIMPIRQFIPSTASHAAILTVPETYASNIKEFSKEEQTLLALQTFENVALDAYIAIWEFEERMFFPRLDDVNVSARINSLLCSIQTSCLEAIGVGNNDIIGYKVNEEGIKPFTANQYVAERSTDWRIFPIDVEDEQLQNQAQDVARKTHATILLLQLSEHSPLRIGIKGWSNLDPIINFFGTST